MSEFADALQNVRLMSKTDTKEQYVKKFTKTAQGSFIGLIGGLMVGWYFKKSLYVYAMIGTLVGGGLNYWLSENEK